MQVVTEESSVDPQRMFEDFDAWAQTHLVLCKRCNYAYNVEGDVKLACGQTQRKLQGIIADLQQLGYTIETDDGEVPALEPVAAADPLSVDDSALD